MFLGSDADKKKKPKQNKNKIRWRFWKYFDQGESFTCHSSSDFTPDRCKVHLTPKRSRPFHPNASSADVMATFGSIYHNILISLASNVKWDVVLRRFFGFVFNRKPFVSLIFYFLLGVPQGSILEPIALFFLKYKPNCLWFTKMFYNCCLLMIPVLIEIIDHMKILVHQYKVQLHNGWHFPVFSAEGT